ncbi:MAG: flagellar biosynthesis anti-sigma factor FlgM [Gammaproteobacteria bacterium]|nr:flagellar biosynthesis anti-sigma factor FlgM [Gammaproteobacteria bacterium]
MSDPFMPIDLRQITTGQTGPGARRAENASDPTSSENKSANANTVAQQDSVELSDKSHLISSIISDLSSRPEVNQSRVEQVRASIASDDFSVSAEKIASKMLDLEVGLRKLI